MAIPKSPRLKWTEINRTTKTAEIVLKLCSYLESRLERVSSLAEWLGVVEDTILGWMETKKLNRAGVSLLLIDGWLAIELEEPIPTDNIQNVLWAAIGRKLTTLETVGQVLMGRDHHTILYGWLYDGKAPSKLIEIMLEAHLESLGLWEPTYKSQLRAPFNLLAEEVATQRVTIADVASLLGFQEERVLGWLRDNSKLNPKVYRDIETCLDSLREQSQASGGTTDTYGSNSEVKRELVVVASEDKTPSAPYPSEPEVPIPMPSLPINLCMMPSPAELIGSNLPWVVMALQLWLQQAGAEELSRFQATFHPTLETLQGVMEMLSGGDTEPELGSSVETLSDQLVAFVDGSDPTSRADFRRLHGRSLQRLRIAAAMLASEAAHDQILSERPRNGR